MEHELHAMLMNVTGKSGSRVWAMLGKQNQTVSFLGDFLELLLG